jgi:hypothetical protein
LSLKNLCTDSVWRFLSPVLLRNDTPRFLLLSRFCNAGDVEKRAMGTRGARKWKTGPADAALKQGRLERAAGNAAIILVVVVVRAAQPMLQLGMAVLRG